MKNGVKLHNMLLPIWFLWLFPITWIVIVPGNFIIDLAVILITLKCMKIDEIVKKAKSTIIKTWLFGFVADFIGVVFMFLPNLLYLGNTNPVNRWWQENLAEPVIVNPFTSLYAAVWVIMCIMIVAIFIYIFNYKICFRKLELDKSKKKKLALSLAIFTAPYLFLIPSSWIH